MKYIKFLLLVCLSSGFLKTLIEFKDFQGIGIYAFILVALVFGWLIYKFYENTEKDFEQNILPHLAASILVLTFLISIRDSTKIVSKFENGSEKDIVLNFDENTKNSRLELKDFNENGEVDDTDIDSTAMIMDTDTLSQTEDYDPIFESMVGVEGSSKIKEKVLKDNTIIKGYKYNLEKIDILRAEWIDASLSKHPSQKKLNSMSFTNNSDKTISTLFFSYEIFDEDGAPLDSGDFYLYNILGMDNTRSKEVFFFEGVEPGKTKKIFLSSDTNIYKEPKQKLILNLIRFDEKGREVVNRQ